jgi:hypothetical protein
LTTFIAGTVAQHSRFIGKIEGCDRYFCQFGVSYSTIDKIAALVLRRAGRHWGPGDYVMGDIAVPVLRGGNVFRTRRAGDCFA